MKFPSLTSLLHATLRVIKRFPFELLFSVIGAIAAVLAIEIGDITKQADLQKWLSRAVMAANLGLVLSFATTLFLEVNPLPKLKKVIIRVCSLIIIGLLFYLLNPYLNEADIFRFVLFSLAFHLLVSFAAFISIYNLNGFWQFNEVLFLRIATSVLYSAVLFIGLAAAIASADVLFNIEINGRVYPQLWVLIVGIFNTVFFLAGVPVDVKLARQEHNYPKQLKLFTQYVLIPLTTVYLLILLAYEVKIIIQWSLPQGYVAMLVLGYAVFGILSLLLVYPIRNLDENKWIKTFSKSFYLLMVPLIILLMLAVYQRIKDYGITEERYFLIVLSAWLAFITAYFIISKKQNIKIIPISLCILALLSIYGPQSAAFVSKQSQTGRLAYFINHPKEKNYNAEVMNIVVYLIKQHGLQSVQPFIKQDLTLIADHFKAKVGKADKKNYTEYQYRYDLQDSVLKLMKIDPNISTITANNNYRSYINADEGMLEIEKASKIVRFNSSINYGNNNPISFNINSKIVYLQIDTGKIYLANNGNRFLVADANSLLNDLENKKFVSSKNQEFKVLNKELSREKIYQNHTVTIRFERLNGMLDHEKGKKKALKSQFFEGYLIIAKN